MPLSVYRVSLCLDKSCGSGVQSAREHRTRHSSLPPLHHIRTSTPYVYFNCRTYIQGTPSHTSCASDSLLYLNRTTYVEALRMSCAPHSLLYFHCTTYAQATPCVYLHCTTYVQATPNVYLDCTTYIQGPVYVFRTRLSALPPLHHVRTRHSIGVALLHHMLYCTCIARDTQLYLCLPASHKAHHRSTCITCCSVLQCVAVWHMTCLPASQLNRSDSLSASHSTLFTCIARACV